MKAGLREASGAGVFVLLAVVAGCASRPPAAPRTGASPTGVREADREVGEASWYGNPYHGRQTASGEIYNMHAMTAAHRSLPFGTVVEVRRRDTGKRVIVRINDRGPFVAGRVIDLSYAAALEIGLEVDGVASVTLVVLEPGTGERFQETREERSGVGEARDCQWVQVGAFGDPLNASRAKNRLTEAGETTVVVEGPEGLKKVRLGPFDRRADAQAALQRVASSWPGARIVECGQ